MRNKRCLLVCPFLKMEVDAVVERDGFDHLVVAAFSPKCDGRQMAWEDIAEALPAGVDSHQVEVAGSFCLAGLEQPARRMDGCRIQCLEHCFSPLVDPDTIAGNLGKGAYLLTPGWLAGWRSRVAALGFDVAHDRELFRDFFTESAGHLLLLDTGVGKNTAEQVQEFSDYTGLPFEVAPVGLDFLRLFLAKIAQGNKC